VVAVRAPSLYLVVPCYNEAARLKSNLFRDCLAQLESLHLLFVNDGSSDRTFSVLSEIRDGLEDRVSIVSYLENRGKAEAVRAGLVHALAKSDCQVVGYWDADLATPLDSVCVLARFLQEHPSIDLIFGSRVKLCGRHIHRRAARHYLGRIFATAVSHVLGMAIYDTQCGAKLFRVTEDVRSVLLEPFLAEWIFDVEILARLIAATNASAVEARTYEYPLKVWEDVSGSKLRPGHFVRAAFDLVRLKRRYL
jgi:dolichyl-phosphate beta-glucosyltransferase